LSVCARWSGVLLGGHSSSSVCCFSFVLLLSSLCLLSSHLLERKKGRRKKCVLPAVIHPFFCHFMRGLCLPFRGHLFRMSAKMAPPVCVSPNGVPRSVPPLWWPQFPKGPVRNPFKGMRFGNPPLTLRGYHPFHWPEPQTWKKPKFIPKNPPREFRITYPF